MQKGFDYLFEKTDQLPSELAEIVLAFNFTGGFTEVVSKYKLHLDQGEILEDLTFRVMFGDLDAVTFVGKLSSDLSLPSGTAKELSEDINSKIIEPVKKALMNHVEEQAEAYKDIELDESELEDEENPTPSPQEFHPKSAYNEPITNDEPAVQHISQKLTHADVLHGIENPHPSIGGNSPIKTASGSKSYADIMAPVKQVKPEVIVPAQKPVEQTPVSVPTPALQQKVDFIAMKSSSITVSAPNKIETLPATVTENLPTVTESKSVDPYKETI